jgi:hypothetical protein
VSSAASCVGSNPATDGGAQGLCEIDGRDAGPGSDRVGNELGAWLVTQICQQRRCVQDDDLVVHLLALMCSLVAPLADELVDKRAGGGNTVGEQTPGSPRR